MDGMSDHQMIITTINARPKIIRNKSRKVYLYKKGNLDAVKDYLDSKLKSFKEKYKEMNIEGYWTTFKSHLFNAMDQYIPLKTLRPVSSILDFLVINILFVFSRFFVTKNIFPICTIFLSVDFL
jgi:hypothetical protein